MDSENRAAMIVTQYEPAKCKIKNYICPDQENFIDLERYRYGGCAYMCRVDENMLVSLGLPTMTIKGNLELTVSMNKEAENKNKGGESGAVANSLSQANVQITDLADYSTFIDAMLAIDFTYANEMIDAGLAENAADGGNGHADNHEDGHDGQDGNANAE